MDFLGFSFCVDNLRECGSWFFCGLIRLARVPAAIFCSRKLKAQRVRADYHHVDGGSHLSRSHCKGGHRSSLLAVCGPEIPIVTATDSWHHLQFGPWWIPYVLIRRIIVASFLEWSEVGGWVQPGSCFVSFVSACARACVLARGLVSRPTEVATLSPFPFGAPSFPFSLPPTTQTSYPTLVGLIGILLLIENVFI